MLSRPLEPFDVLFFDLYNTAKASCADTRKANLRGYGSRSDALELKNCRRVVDLTDTKRSSEEGRGRWHR